jgi:hypothetical protein
MIEIQGLEGVLEYFQGSLKVLDAAIVIGGEGLAGDMANRVHLDGIASDGGDIGPNPSTGEVYSSKPFFALTRNFAKRGYPANLVSGTGFSVQLPHGYRDFREFSGRQVDRVDLKYSGHLQTSYRFVRDKSGAYRIGFLGEQTPGDQGTTAAQKAAYLEGLYQKDIFSPTEEEIDNFFGDIAFEWSSRSS